MITVMNQLPGIFDKRYSYVGDFCVDDMSDPQKAKLFFEKAIAAIKKHKKLIVHYQRKVKRPKTKPDTEKTNENIINLEVGTNISCYTIGWVFSSLKKLWGDVKSMSAYFFLGLLYVKFQSSIFMFLAHKYVRF
jgi:hypothetical protein